MKNNSFIITTGVTSACFLALGYVAYVILIKVRLYDHAEMIGYGNSVCAISILLCAITYCINGYRDRGQFKTEPRYRRKHLLRNEEIEQAIESDLETIRGTFPTDTEHQNALHRLRKVLQDVELPPHIYVSSAERDKLKEENF